jgi:hypothetical protein
LIAGVRPVLPGARYSATAGKFPTTDVGGTRKSLEYMMAGELLWIG